MLCAVVVIECSFWVNGSKMTVTDFVPLVGMPAQMDPGGGIEYLSRQYTNSVAAAGGSPVIIPLADTAERWFPLVERLDGILLTGNNSDMDPACYRASRIPQCGASQPLRDKTDFLLLEIAFQRRIPLLAICFGIQSLNVFCGGSLIQDIPESIGVEIAHNRRESGNPASHTINIFQGSILEQIAGEADVVVNSTHHQAIERIGNNLDVIARAPDGVIESVVYSNRDHWILGVQWHPEKSFNSDGFSRRLFEHFLARCRAARGSDEGYNS